MFLSYFTENMLHISICWVLYIVNSSCHNIYLVFMLPNTPLNTHVTTLVTFYNTVIYMHHAC